MPNASRAKHFALGVRRELVARHYLVGGDFGPEGEPHSHHYRIEVVLESDRLDQHGFLLDIVAVKKALDEKVTRYRDATLNELPEFDGENTSCETFSRVLAEGLDAELSDSALTALSVKVWEDENAWGSCRLERSEGEH